MWLQACCVYALWPTGFGVADSAKFCRNADIIAVQNNHGLCDGCRATHLAPKRGKLPAFAGWLTGVLTEIPFCSVSASDVNMPCHVLVEQLLASTISYLSSCTELIITSKTQHG